MVERGGHRRGGAARSVALPALLVLASLSSAAAQGVRTPESIVAGVQRARDEVTDAHLRAIKALATDAPEDALIDVVWLWTEAGSQPSGPMPMDRLFRDTMLAGTTRRLVAKSPAARTVLEGHRQSLQDEVFGDDPDPHVLADWFTLSSILGEEEELLAWHDVWEARTGAHPRLIGSARPTLMRVLVEHTRFAEAGKMAVVPRRVVDAGRSRRCRNRRAGRQPPEQPVHDAPQGRVAGQGGRASRAAAGRPS